MKPKNPVLISQDKLDAMLANPDGPLSPLGKFIFYSKYSRWREDMRRREYWAETNQRATEYNVNLAIAHLEEKGMMTDELRQFHQRELDALAEAQFNLRQFLSGRTLWIGGTPASYLNPMANFNCSFLVLDAWKKLGELMHLGMVGTGIGFRILQVDIDKLAPIKIRKWNIIHSNNRVPKEERLEHSELQLNAHTKTAVIVIGDSKEGHCKSVDFFFDILTGKYGTQWENIKIEYGNIREAGERIKRFGGRAGGPQAVMRMFDTFHRILTGTLTEDYPKITPGGRIRPIHALDLANAIGKNIVSGGVRSIAEIALLDPNDKETIEAKSNIFGIEALNHRFVSNNSVFYEERPTDEQFDWQFDTLQYNGEPCFVNAVVARRRRPNFNGVNPCVEILLDDRGLCNLTTTNVTAFVKDGKLDRDGLIEAMKLSARAGLRMTLPKLELPEWDAIQQRDRLLGVSLTGWMDAMDAIDKGDDREFQAELLRELKKAAREAADEYADMLGVNRPLLVTAVKPEGTISQLAGGVSSGIHVSHAKYFLRRVRSAAKDPISRAVFDLGWRMSAEFQDGSQHAEIREFAQYVPWMDTTNKDGQDGLLPKRYEYWMGQLRVKFHVRSTDTDISKIYENLRVMLDAYYNGKVSNIRLTNKPEGVPEGFVTVEYTVVDPDYDTIFGHSTKVVIDFPQSTTAKRTKANYSAIEQLETYKMFLHNYTEHNPSNTISVRPEEWGAVKEWVKANWDDMLAVSFLTLYDAPYPLLPYEECSKQEVENLRANMEDFDPAVLMKYDVGEDMELVDAGCETGACPVR